ELLEDMQNLDAREGGIEVPGIDTDISIRGINADINIRNVNVDEPDEGINAYLETARDYVNSGNLSQEEISDKIAESAVFYVNKFPDIRETVLNITLSEFPESYDKVLTALAGGSPTDTGTGTAGPVIPAEPTNKPEETASSSGSETSSSSGSETASSSGSETS